MGAGERRGLTRASGKTAGPERALLLGYRRRCGPWLLLPSCPRWSPGCSGPHRIAASIVVSSTSLQFGKRAGSWVSAASRAEPSVGGRLGSRGTLKDSLSISARGGCGHREEGGGRRGSRAQPQSATWVLALGARSAGWAVTRCPPFRGSRSPAGLGCRPFPGPIHWRDGVPVRSKGWRVRGRSSFREHAEVTGWNLPAALVGDAEIRLRESRGDALASAGKDSE